MSNCQRKVFKWHPKTKISCTMKNQISLSYVMELGDISNIIKNTDTEVIDLPLSHLEILSDAVAHSRKYRIALEARKSNGLSVVVTPFGMYRTLENFLEMCRNSDYMQEIVGSFIESRRKPKSDFDIGSLDYLQ